MKGNEQKLKVLFCVLCLICSTLSFLIYIIRNKSTIDDLVAPINVNIEIDKTHADNLVLVTIPNEIIRQLTPTTSMESSLDNIIIHNGIYNEYIQDIFLRIPIDQVNTVIPSINNVSVFIGNKLFYFYAHDITGWEYTQNNIYADYKIPVGIYKKAPIKPYINWYGNLNYALKEITALITMPHKFIFVYVFILLFLLMFYTEIIQCCKKYSKQMEIILLILLLIFGFLLRISNITKHSAWVDELYSAGIFSNPNLQFSNIFIDGGNPPFYYLILRIWFMIFGWSETTGRLLSVFLGTGAIVSVYFFTKAYCGRKHAFISALLLAISLSSIGYSNQMKAYSFLIMFVPIISHMFILFLREQKLLKSCIYTICGIILVNTHIYVILFIAGSFIFYFIYNYHNLEWRKIINFVLINIIIALSIIPWFYFTIYKSGSGISTWIPKPGKEEIIYAFLSLFIYIIFKIFLCLIKKHKIFKKREILIIDYALFMIVFIYFSALLISLLVPILYPRYLVICLPFVIAILPFFIFITNEIIFTVCFRESSFKLPINIIVCLVFFFQLNFIKNWSYFHGGDFGFFKESQQYISMDSRNYDSATQIKGFAKIGYAELYGLNLLPEYSKNKSGDVVYYSPLLYSGNYIIKDYEINQDNILIIYVDKQLTWYAGNIIYKIILNNN
jgi:uncharacterized membrane protein